MTFARHKKCAAVPPSLISAVLLLFTAGLVPAFAFAQSVEGEEAKPAARPRKLTTGFNTIKPALLSLQQEFAATLHKITPELLILQEELVKALRIQIAGMAEEERVGQRTLEDVMSASQAYFRELETLQVMKARSRKKSISERELLKLRIEVRSEALSLLKAHSQNAAGRYQTGEITRTEVAGARAEALKAEIMLEALKRAAGE